MPNQSVANSTAGPTIDSEAERARQSVAASAILNSAIKVELQALSEGRGSREGAFVDSLSVGLV